MGPKASSTEDTFLALCTCVCSSSSLLWALYHPLFRNSDRLWPRPSGHDLACVLLAVSAVRVVSTLVLLSEGLKQARVRGVAVMWTDVV
jgi:hypothetical protein